MENENITIPHAEYKQMKRQIKILSTCATIMMFCIIIQNFLFILF